MKSNQRPDTLDPILVWPLNITTRFQTSLSLNEKFYGKYDSTSPSHKGNSPVCRHSIKGCNTMVF